MKKNECLIIIFLAIIFIILIVIFYKKNIDKFENMEDNIYTFDTCCSEKEKEHCMTYGKTGVCNYYKNNGECLCQNAY
jgi:hypothetical protein